MTKKNLNKTILAAIQTYYFNRNRARQGIAKWNKRADLDLIADVANKYGYRFAAISGAFFFTYAVKNGNKTVQMTEESFPNTTPPII